MLRAMAYLSSALSIRSRNLGESTFCVIINANDLRRLNELALSIPASSINSQKCPANVFGVNPLLIDFCVVNSCRFVSVSKMGNR